jgi:hypothetical protein
VVLILGPVNCWILLGLFHGWFDVEVEVNPGTYTTLMRGCPGLN